MSSKGITITKNFGNLADLPLSTPAVMKDLLLLARERVIRRTLSGMSATGTPFAPYSPGYRKAKAEALGGSLVPNLQVSGRMLQDIEITVLSPVKGELGFKS